MNEKLNYLLEHHYSLFHADCISRALHDDSISIDDFREGLKEIRFAEREGIDEYDPFDGCEHKFAVFNGRNQFLDYFDTLDDAIHYIEENEPKNELWTIDVEL